VSNDNDFELYVEWNRLARPYIAWQFSFFRQHLGKRVADVGAALGNFFPFMEDKELLLAIEPDERFGTWLQEHWGASRHVRVVTGAEADVCGEACVRLLRGSNLDSVLCVNVLEHIKDDRGALRNMVDGLPTGGKLCLLVPAMPCAYGSLDEIALHHRRYSRQMLLDVVEGLPVRIVTLRYVNALGGIGWYVKSRLLRVRKYASGNFKLMNIALPFIKLAEAAIHPPFGLSLVCVLEKVDGL
jgi:SAM-dependent methyltransferase